MHARLIIHLYALTAEARDTSGLRKGVEDVAAAGAYGCLPRVFRPPVIWLESTKT